MNLPVEPYLAQVESWPQTGRHILAQYDAESVVVYQAFHPPTGQYAARHGRFGVGFSLNRMSWIKPNFLWMMYRSGWGSKAKQEVTLAIRLRRDAFDAILRQAVHSSFSRSVYGDEGAWSEAVARSEVRLQWDPDHDPAGRPVERRAIQLGLRGSVLGRFAGEWILEIQDLSEFVVGQRGRAIPPFEGLLTPRESVYPVEDPELAARLGVSVAG